MSTLNHTTPHTVHTRIGLREVYRLAWPVVISMLSFTLMSLVDTLFVARLGDLAVGAIGLAALSTWLIASFGHGLLEGAKVAVAQSTGAEDDLSARQLGWQSLWIALAVAVVTMLLIPLGPGLFELLGASDAQSDLADSYLSWRLLGAPLMFALFALHATLHGMGDMQTPMRASVLGNVLNIGLDPLLIFGLGPIPALGIAGAAIATVLSHAISLWWLWRRARSRLSGVSPRPCRVMMKRIWGLGAPLGLREALDMASYAIFAGLLTHAGESHLAAHVIAVRIIAFSFLPGHAISQAACVLAGQSVGAKRFAGVKETFVSATALALLFMGGCAILFLAIPGPLFGLFLPSPEVHELGVTLLTIAAVFQLVDAIAMVAIGTLNGAGDTRFVMTISVTCAWLIKLPLAWLLALEWDGGAAAAWVAMTIEISLIAALTTWRLRARHTTRDRRHARLRLATHNA